MKMEMKGSLLENLIEKLQRKSKGKEFGGAL